MKIVITLAIVVFGFCVNGQNVLSYKLISSNSGNFSGLGSGIETFGRSIKSIGDINKDGIPDLAVGAYDASTLSGNIFILFMKNDFTVNSFTRIGPNLSGFNGVFPFSTNGIGSFLDTINDIDNDGINEIIAGNIFGGGNSVGELYLIYLNLDGTVKKWNILETGSTNNEYFGAPAVNIGDINKDGVNDIAVSSNGDNSGSYVGVINILFLNKDGTVKSKQKIGSNKGNFKGVLSGPVSFGKSLSSINDLNNDGYFDLVTSSQNALWVLFLDSLGLVKSHQKIDKDSGGYNNQINPTEGFGNNITFISDINNDGITDLVISSPGDSVNNKETGSVKVVFLNTNGTVKLINRIDNNSANLIGVLSDKERFGLGLTSVQFDNNFKTDLLVGSPQKDNKGAIYLLSLDGSVHPTPPKAFWRVNAISGNQNTVFNFTQYSTGFPSAYKWSISPNTFTYQNGTSDTSANPIIKFNATANYSIQLKVTNPFSSDSLLRSSYINIQTVGINNLTKNTTAISIFPNPTHGLVQIQSPVNMQSILVFDITGKQLLQQEPNTQTDEINISNLPQGLYQIHIQTEMGVLVKKLVKE